MGKERPKVTNGQGDLLIFLPGRRPITDAELEREMMLCAQARKHERRSCPRYEDCLDQAAREDAICVPCANCSGPKQHMSQNRTNKPRPRLTANEKSRQNVVRLLKQRLKEGGPCATTTPLGASRV